MTMYAITADRAPARTYPHANAAARPDAPLYSRNGDATCRVRPESCAFLDSGRDCGSLPLRTRTSF